MIIIVEFNGACVTDDYPFMGKETGAAEALRRLAKRGHSIMLSYINPSGYPLDTHFLKDAEKWFQENGIPLYYPVITGVNGNYSFCMTYVYISAKALNCPLIYGDHKKPYVDWIKVEEILASMDEWAR